MLKGVANKYSRVFHAYSTGTPLQIVLVGVILFRSAGHDRGSVHARHRFSQSGVHKLVLLQHALSSELFRDHKYVVVGLWAAPASCVDGLHVGSIQCCTELRAPNKHE